MQKGEALSECHLNQSVSTLEKYNHLCKGIENLKIYLDFCPTFCVL